jgi:hypothetical protein
LDRSQSQVKPSPERHTLSIGDQAAAHRHIPLLIDPAKGPSASQVRRSNKQSASVIPTFKPKFQSPESVRIRRKQRRSAFTNFIEIPYAFFTKAVLKYIRSARTKADRRV